jgi:ribosomal protein L11 methyltransferase
VSKRLPSGERLPSIGGQGGPAQDAWLELAVEVDDEAVEAVSEILARVAPGGVSVEPAFVLEDEGLSARVDPTRPATVRAYVPAREPVAAAAAADRAARDLGHLQAFGLRPIGELRSRTVHETDWAEAWKAHFPVLRIGRRLIVRPTWRRHRRRDDEVVVALDPGMAFGTGLHPTTRACLSELERLSDAGALAGDAGRRVLDVGCGSGILAIAAGLLGAASVVAVDPDPIAVEATVANADRNGLARRIDARLGSIPTGEHPFDLVLANLIASLLIRLASALRDEIAPGGRLVASGIFIDRESAVVEAFGSVGLHVQHRTVDGDWVALVARRA